MLGVEMILDVGRALPRLVAELQTDPIPPGVSLGERTDHLDAHADGLRSRCDILSPVIDRGGPKLAAAFEEWDPASIVGPEGEGAEALEKAEAYSHAHRDDLACRRSTRRFAQKPWPRPPQQCSACVLAPTHRLILACPINRRAPSRNRTHVISNGVIPSLAHGHMDPPPPTDGTGHAVMLRRLMRWQEACDA